MNRVKHFLILVLALTMSFGAWAQTDPAVQVTKDNNLDWNFTMPDYDAVVGVTLKAQPGLAWTYGGRAIPNDTTLTAYLGFHLPVIAQIGTTMNPDFAVTLSPFIQITDPSSWSNDNTPLSASDLPGFQEKTQEQAQNWIDAPDGTFLLIYGFHGSKVKVAMYENGNSTEIEEMDFPRTDVYTYIEVLHIPIYYTSAGATLRFGSTNPAVVSFGNPNSLTSFSVNGLGECDVYMVFDGNDDYTYDSVAFHANFLAPDTLTLAKTGNGTVEALVGDNGEVVWNDLKNSGLSSYTQDGVTMTPSNGSAHNNTNLYDYGSNTFTSTLGNFTKIEIVCTTGEIGGWTKEVIGQYQPEPGMMPDFWDNIYKLTWEGDAESVSLQNDVYNIQSITFTFGTAGSDSIVAIEGQAGKYLVIPDATVQAVATAAEGNHVSSWSNNDEVTNLLSDTNSIIINGNTTLIANFAQNPLLTLASNNSEWGSVTLNTGTTLPEGVIAGGTAGTFRVIPGTEVTLNAEAAAQHHVAGWKDENQNDLATATYSNYAVTTPSNMFPGTSALTFTVTGDTTAMAMFGINSSDITASVANTTDVRGTVRIAYTDVQGAAQVSDSLATVTASAQGGSTATLTAYPAWGYHFVKWVNINGDSLSNLTTLEVTSAVDTTLVAVFDTTKAELAWSEDEFTGYTMINFNNDKPTITNPHHVSVRYGLAENINFVKVNPETGFITNNYNVPRLTPQGTYHIYAVHETDQTYFYDSVVYTLNVNWGAMVSILKNIEAGGSTAFLNAEDDLTHAYSNSNNTMMAFLAPGASFTATATANEGYHFSKWQTGGNNAGYTDFATTAEATYTAPTQITSLYYTALKAVFDTNTYALNVEVANGQDDRGSVSGSNSAAKHFLSYEISATPETGYHFTQWNDGNTDSLRTVSLVSDSTFTASFAPDTFTVTYMNGTAQLKVEKVPYHEPIPEYIPSKQGWTFKGWTPALPNLMPAENLTVNVQWACDTLEDYDGNKYPSVQIGSKCWMAANLKTTHYADGRPVDNIYEYQSYAYPNVTENVSIYGRLYDWYTTLDTTTLTVGAHIQGICPAGWYLPSAEDMAVLNAIPAPNLRSTTRWIDPNHNTNSTGFTAYPAGRFNSSTARYEGMGTETSWWSTIDPDPSTVITPSVVVTAKSLCNSYFCDTIFLKSYLPTDGLSVRCVSADEK